MNDSLANIHLDYSDSVLIFAKLKWTKHNVCCVIFHGNEDSFFHFCQTYQFIGMCTNTLTKNVC